MKRREFDEDNRDTMTTELHIEETNIVVTVNPWELLRNLIENAGLSETEEADMLKTLAVMQAVVTK
jgi:hypothetical protein